MAVGIYFLLRQFLKRHSLHTRYLYVFYLLGAPSIPMSEDDRFMRLRGEPSPAFYKKAKDKYKSFTDSAITEFQRLLGLNNKQTLNTRKNPAKYATFYHLNKLRLRGNFR